MRTKGATDETKRRSREFTHSFARQFLADHGTSVFRGNERVLTPVPKLFDIQRPKTRFYRGEIFVEKAETKKITGYAELVSLGFVIVSSKMSAEQRWDAGLRNVFTLKPFDQVAEHIEKMPKDHYIEYDPFNKAVRLIGPNAGPLGASNWELIVPRKGAPRGIVSTPNFDTISKQPDYYLNRQINKWRGVRDDIKPVNIKEAAFMITDANEIVCIPDSQDMPSILISGMKGCQIGTDKVLMGDGTFKEIKDVRVGDRVISPQEDNKITYARVMMTYSWDCEEMYDIMDVSGNVLYTCSYNHLVTRYNGKRVVDVTAKKLFNSKLNQEKNGGLLEEIKELKKLIKYPNINIRKSKPAVVYGFNLESESGRYVTNNYIVTHNSGKSFCLHSIVSRLFWKKEFSYNIAILNDSSGEAGPWCLPNKDVKQQHILSRLNEQPLPLPCVYFHPIVKEDYEKLFMGDVGFDITIPFAEIINNHRKYLNLAESTRYFTKFKDRLAACKTQKDAEEILELVSIEEGVPPQTANKIRAEFETLFDVKMTDISSGKQQPWSTSRNQGIKYNPITATIQAGALPVIETAYISNKPRLLSTYFSYIVDDLFNRQKQDRYFTSKNSKLLLVLDETHIIAGTANTRNSEAEQLLTRCVREGRPRRVGTLLATQHFGQLPEVITGNTTYLLCFQNPAEAAKIGSRYNLGQHVIKQLKGLDKHQMLAWTSNYFIVYDNEGKCRKSKLGEVFIGKTLPPYSQHKKPGEEN